MNYRTLVLIVIVIAAVLLAGCTNQSNKTAQEKKAENNTGETIQGILPGADISGTENSMEEETESATGRVQSSLQESMSLNDTINIYLKENPTTGFQWNATVTSGLRIENDTYVADPVSPGVAGSGGMHYWLVRGIAKGDQVFDAVYMRSWEPVTGNESRYTMNIQVI